MVSNASSFVRCWTGAYRELIKFRTSDVEEEITYNMLELLGWPVDIKVIIDENHAENKISRRSEGPILELMFCNIVSIDWYSKSQNMVETSLFTSTIWWIDCVISSA